MSDRCAHASVAVGEPLGGSAAHATEWLIVEDRSVWTRDALDAPGVADIRDELAAWMEGGKRRLLVVRPDDEVGERRIWLAAPGSARWARLDGPLSEGRFVDEPREPLLLVCAHGARDGCCGTLGGALLARFKELGAPVWQTSHIGGHRFAPTLLWLPTGYAFGRVAPDEAEALLAAVREGRLYDLDRVRGRVDLPAPAQVAELSARRAGAATSVDAVRWVSADGEVHRVSVDGIERDVTVRQHTLEGLRPKSCGKDAVPLEVWLAD